MRTGGYTLQQALTVDAARVVNQAVTLARRRGHAQVTPLHVANTLLAASTGLFRTACLQSHSHPLQCKALELCFNVALNRLPASSASPMLGTNSQHTSISNALVAAFKRAQAHQRRGSIENQQQPLLAVKIELEQLIISILDDPSVSRVMREAGFSSTQVKSNVEQAVSLEICSQTPSLSSKSKESNQLALLQSQPVGQSGTKIDKPVVSDLIKNEDVRSVIDHLMNKRRKSTVIVGECLDNLENTVRGVMNKVDKGDVPEDLRKVNFIQVTLSSFGHRSRVDVEQKLGELKRVVKSCLNKGVVLYLGDLDWVTDYRASSTEQERGYYCPVEHMIVELGKLISGIGEPGSFWLMGIATFQTYMKCKSSGHPSLEAVWGLHPLTIPAASLRLSLITADSTDLQSQSTSKKAENGNSSLLLEGGQEQQHHLACCAECSAKFDMEAQSLQSSTCNSVSTTSSQLPAWLRQYKNESIGFISNDQNYVPVRDHLCKKWNSICSSIHKQPHSSEKTARTFSSLSPSTSTSCFSHDRPYPNLHQIIHHEWPVAEPKKSWRPHHRIWISEDSNVTVEPRLIMGIPENGDSKQPFSSYPNSTSNSPSSSEVMMETEYSHRFKELSAENMKTLCSALEKKVPWQKDIIPEIANTILQCRSGMARRKGMARNNVLVKEETWLFFQGADTEAKEKIARELAKLIFGSRRCLISIAMSTFSSTRADSTEDCKNKRSREDQSCSYIERFAEAVSTNPHMVFLVEDVEQADYFSQIGFKRAIERGRIANCDGEEVDLSDAIIILSCESFSSRSRACSPPIKQKSEGSEDQKGAALEETSPCVSLDLNISIDDDCAADQSIDEIGLLETVDKRFYFKIQEL